MIDLTGKHIFIAGGSRGIGAAAASWAAAAGAAVSVNYLRDEKAAAGVVADVEAAGGRGFAVQADVAEDGAIDRAVDAAARATIHAALDPGGFGRDYGTPGLPHRTGHGIGMDVHEPAYMVRGNRTPLVPGMCFSIEPTICIYGEFGVRLEDIAYMTDQGPRWFTQPCPSVDDPFGTEDPA